MPARFVCGDCGVRVLYFGREAPPDPPLCSLCAFISTVADPQERSELRTLLLGDARDQ